MGNKKILIKDVARRANVSPTLVSLVLNNKADRYGIKRETQEFVMEMARRMGYFSADSLQLCPAQTTPGIMGIVVSDINYTALQIAQNIRENLSEKGFSFAIVFGTPACSSYLRQIESYSLFFSGLIFVGDTATKSVVSTLLAKNYPFVVIGDKRPPSVVNFIHIDNRTIADTVAQFIEQQSYNNVLIVCDKECNSSSATLCFAIKRAIQERNIDQTIEMAVENVSIDSRVLQYDFSPILSFLRPPYRTDVIVVVNYQLIEPLLKALETYRVRISRDIEIISIEELCHSNSLCYNNIISLKYPHKEIAEQCQKALFDEIKNGGKSKRKLQFNAIVDINR